MTVLNDKWKYADISAEPCTCRLHVGVLYLRGTKQKKLALNDDVIGQGACAESAQPAMSLPSSCDISTDASQQKRDVERRRRRP